MPKVGDAGVADKQAGPKSSAQANAAPAVPGRTIVAEPADGDDGGASSGGPMYRKPSLFRAATPPPGVSGYSRYTNYQAGNAPPAQQPAAIGDNAAQELAADGVVGYEAAEPQQEPAQPHAPVVGNNALAPQDIYSRYQAGPALDANNAAAHDAGAAAGVVGYYAAAEQQPVSGYYAVAEQQQAPAPYVRRANNEHRAPLQVNEQGITTRRLGGFYADEQHDASTFRGAPSTWQHDINAEAAPGHPAPQLSSVTTHYMNEHEQAAHTLSVADGKLKGADGADYDTSAASGIGTQLHAGAGKHIFSLTPGGPDAQARAADPWAQKQLTPKQDGTANLGFVNHSSLVAGGEVASAGELTVRKGQLQQISDSSGHYQPNGVMLKQALHHFGSKGVDVNNVDVRFAPKTNDPSDPASKPVIASSREFANYADPNAAEAGMRAHRAKLRTGIAAAAQRRDERVGDKSIDQIRHEERVAREAGGLRKKSDKDG